jgi:hypothetical protein
MLPLEALTERVERTRSDVAVDDAECEEGKAGEARPARVGLRMDTYVMSSNGSGTWWPFWPNHARNIKSRAGSRKIG